MTKCLRVCDWTLSDYGYDPHKCGARYLAGDKFEATCGEPCDFVMDSQRIVEDEMKEKEVKYHDKLINALTDTLDYLKGVHDLSPRHMLETLLEEMTNE